MFVSARRKWSCSVMSDSLRPHGLKPTRLLLPWDFPGKSTGVGCHLLLQGIFPTQGSDRSQVPCIVGRHFDHLSHLSLVEEKGGYSLAVVCGLQTAASVIVALRLSCSEACGILVPKPGIKPLSAALAGRFLTTGPPGKPGLTNLKGTFLLSIKRRISLFRDLGMTGTLAIIFNGSQRAPSWGGYFCHSEECLASTAFR